MCSGPPLDSRTSILQLGDVGKAQQPSLLACGCSSQCRAPRLSSTPKLLYPAQEHLRNPAFPSYPLTRECLPLGSRNAKAQADAAQRCHLQSHPHGHVHGCVAPPLRAQTSISMPTPQCLHAPTRTYGTPDLESRAVRAVSLQVGSLGQGRRGSRDKPAPWATPSPPAHPMGEGAGRLMEQGSATFSFVLLPGIVQRVGSLGREQKMKGFSSRQPFLWVN